MSNLSVLTLSEQQAFDHPPILPTEMQIVCFSINSALKKEINTLKTPSSKVGFLLQYAYFKACKRFFIINRFTQDQIKHAATLLNMAPDEIDLTSYKKNIPTEHQKKILKLLGHTLFNRSVHVWLKEEMLNWIEQQMEPKQIFIQSISLLQQHKIEVPSYHRLAEIITSTFAEFEDRLLKKMSDSLGLEDKKFLDALLKRDEFTSQTALNQLKIINQSTKPKAIQASLITFKRIKDYFLKLKPTIDVLKLSVHSIIYYSTWVQKSKLSQLKQFPDENKRYLHLLAFLQHQFYLRQDYFMDVILKCVQSSKNAVANRLHESEQLTRAERRKAVRYLSKSHCHQRELIDEIANIVKSPLLTDKGKVGAIQVLLNEHTQQQNEAEKQRVDLYEKSLASIAKDEEYFDHLEKSSLKLQHRLTHVISLLTFNEASSDKDLLSAIGYLREKEGQVSQQAPLEFLSEEERDALWDKDNRFRTSLYKILLFIHCADAIKSGALNLYYSYRYKAIQDYLIDETAWKKHRLQLIKTAGLEKFLDYPKTLEQLKQTLEEKYQKVNQRLLEKRNPYLSVDEKGDIHVTTSAIEKEDTEYTAALLEQAGYVPI
jgi:Domain of unknown function (DUF4158)